MGQSAVAEGTNRWQLVRRFVVRFQLRAVKELMRSDLRRHIFAIITPLLDDAQVLLFALVDLFVIFLSRQA